MKTIKVLIAEDHTVVRQGLKLLIESEPDFRCVGEAANGEEAMCLARSTNPEIILMDIAMEHVNGIKAARLIKHESPHIKIIFLSMHSEDEFVMEAIDAGASGYLVKHSAASELIEALRVVHANDNYFSVNVSRSLVQAYRKMNQHRIEAAKNPLTAREKEVLQLISKGLTSREISERLYISMSTVQTHRYRIRDKLNLHDIASLTRYAVEHDI